MQKSSDSVIWTALSEKAFFISEHTYYTLTSYIT